MKMIKVVPRETFKKWIQEKQVRLASLEDVWGTHHDRPCFYHPNTRAPFVALPNTEAASWVHKTR